MASGHYRCQRLGLLDPTRLATRTTCGELKDSARRRRSMADTYAKFATDNLRAAAARIDSTRAANVTKLVHFCHSGVEEGVSEVS